MEEVTDKGAALEDLTEKKTKGTTRPAASLETAFGNPRDFLENRFVYVVVSPRARGLSVGVNMNPDRKCNFDCVYCEVDRHAPLREQSLDVDAMSMELKRTLAIVQEGRLRERAGYHNLPDELLQLRHVALSGDGEPTLAPHFIEAMEAVVHVRALSGFPFFKLVLITNGTGLDQPLVQQGLHFLTRRDEVWVKLDGGTQAYVNKVCRAEIPLDKILANILMLGKERPVIIQSLFPAIHNEGPPLEEIDQFALRLRELRERGAQISLVQIYSANRPTPNSECGHLPLKVLSRIAQTVRQVSGLKAEVF